MELRAHIADTAQVAMKMAWHCNAEQQWVAEVERFVGRWPHLLELATPMRRSAMKLGRGGTQAWGSGGPPSAAFGADPVNLHNPEIAMGRGTPTRRVASSSAWELAERTKENTKGGHACKHCKGFWKANRGASRFFSPFTLSAGI